MGTEEDFENEGAPAPVVKNSKKVATPEPEPEPVLVEEEEVVETSPVESGDEEADDNRMPVRIELSRLVFRAPMKNSQSVRYLQDLLSEAGFPVGSDPRGWLAEGTRDALSAFQGKAGLPVTGEADEVTVGALFASSREYVAE